MTFPITLTITADTVAWYAAFISTALLIIKFIEFLREMAHIKIKVRTGYRVVGMEPDYPSDTDHVVITVINKGKRPVTIKTVGVISKTGNNNGVLTDGFHYGSRELTEGKSTDYLIRQDLLDLNDIKYFAIYDSTDREFRGKLKKS